MGMRSKRIALLALLSGMACPGTSPAEPGAVTRILVRKGAHTMTLYDGNRPVASYRVAVGSGGAGPKRMEGDKVTPVGRYRVASRKKSVYTVFLRLDYPNAADEARFSALKAKGAIPENATIGSFIGIHGSPPQPLLKPLHKQADWTAGCVAVDDDEIVQIAGRVKNGTVVDIED